jgi:hypothetical protein
MPARSGVNTVNTATDWPSYGNTLGGDTLLTGQSDQCRKCRRPRVGLDLSHRRSGAFKATPLQVGELLLLLYRRQPGRGLWTPRLANCAGSLIP